MVANTYLEGTYSEIYPDIIADADGLRRCSGSSLPWRHSSHAAPETPGSIHEGGELGYALVTLMARLSTIPICWSPASLATARPRPGRSRRPGTPTSFSTRPRRSVLPILHLNGYKIANPTVMGRMNDEEIRHLFLGYGHEPLFVEGDEPMAMHRQMADALEHGHRAAFARFKRPRATAATGSARDGR